MKLNQFGMMRRALMICLAVCVTLCAVAQRNRIYVDSFEIARGGTVTVPVMLANQDTTRGVQFRVTLPQGLRCVEMNVSQRAERKGFILNKTLKDDFHSVMIYQVGTACFAPGDMAIAEMTLQADETFGGGEITVWKCRGSTMDNLSIEMDGGMAIVTIPMAAQGGSFLDAPPMGD